MFGSGSSVIAKVLWALGAQAASGSAAAGPDASPRTATTVPLESKAPATTLLKTLLLKTFMPANFRRPIPGAHRESYLYLPEIGLSHRHHLTHRSISIHFSGVAAAYGTAL
jgi:hypothetical protein